jgi:hypothetical protein
MMNNASELGINTTDYMPIIASNENEKFLIDLRLFVELREDEDEHCRSYSKLPYNCQAIAKVYDSSGNFLESFGHNSTTTIKTVVSHSAFCQAVRYVAEHGGAQVDLLTNYRSLYLDFVSRDRAYWEVTKYTYRLLDELGIHVGKVRLTKSYLR